MSKSYVKELAQVYRRLFADFAYAYPALEREFQKDEARLTRAVETRGIAVFTVDLPRAGKHLDRCLSAGEYKESGLPLTKRASGSQPIPKFLRGLLLLVFHKDGRLKENPDEQAICFARQAYCLAKRTSLACPADRVTRACEDFIDQDAELPEPGEFWDTGGRVGFGSDGRSPFQGFRKSGRYRTRVGAGATKDGAIHLRTPASAIEFLIKLDIVSGMISTTLGSYDPMEWPFRHGPGVLSNIQRGEFKYEFAHWSAKLESVYPFADCGFHNYNGWVDSLTDFEGESSDDVIPSSRLIAVPKTIEKPRLIAAEPQEHMWCQQNLRHFMYERCDRSWIRHFCRFNDQSLNQDLCTLGSRDGSLLTVDLSAASDRVSCLAVGNLFRSNPSVLKALAASRTQVMTQSLVPTRPAVMALRKFSTMGNACTFPVESLLFLSIALAAVLTQRHLPVTKGNLLALAGSVAVYGDDIIVPVESREQLYDGLEVLDFKINVDKTFSEGNFRESCGVDAFRGTDVTPVYWRQPCSCKPESVTSTVDVANNLYKRFLVHTSAYVASTIKGISFPLKTMDSGAFALSSFVIPECQPSIKLRWNKDLQRNEYLGPRLIAGSRRVRVNAMSALLQYFTEAPEPTTMWESGIALRPSLKLRRGWVDLNSLDSSPKA